jgi:hypothetical protein
MGDEQLGPRVDMAGCAANPEQKAHVMARDLEGWGELW